MRERIITYALIGFILLLPAICLVTGSFVADYPTHKVFAETLMDVGKGGLLVEFILGAGYIYGH